MLLSPPRLGRTHPKAGQSSPNSMNPPRDRRCATTLCEIGPRHWHRCCHRRHSEVTPLPSADSRQNLLRRRRVRPRPGNETLPRPMSPGLESQPMRRRTHVNCRPCGGRVPNLAHMRSCRPHEELARPHAELARPSRVRPRSGWVRSNHFRIRPIRWRGGRIQGDGRGAKLTNSWSARWGAALTESGGWFCRFRGGLDPIWGALDRM